MRPRPDADMARDLQTLARRGVTLLCVYSGEWRKYAYEGQLRDVFPEIPLAPLLTERMMPTPDHLYFTQPERDRLLTTVGAWLRQQYGCAPWSHLSTRGLRLDRVLLRSSNQWTFWIHHHFR